MPSWSAPRVCARARDAGRDRRPSRRPARLGVLDVLARCRCRARPTSARGPSTQHAIERRRRAVAASPPWPAADGHAARDLVHERLARGRRARRRSSGRREQPHAAVDVVADAAGRDDAVGRLASRRRRRPGSRSPGGCRASPAPRSTMPGSVATFCELLERAVARRSASSSSSSANTRAGTRMSARARGAGSPEHVVDAPQALVARATQTSSTTVARAAGAVERLEARAGGR